MLAVRQRVATAAAACVVTAATLLTFPASDTCYCHCHVHPLRRYKLDPCCASIADVTQQVRHASTLHTNMAANYPTNALLLLLMTVPSPGVIFAAGVLMM